MWDWVVTNKQWIFSGAGLTALGVVWWCIRKLFGAPKPLGVTQTNTNSVVQSPVINVNTYPVPPPESPKPIAPPDTTGKPPDLRPPKIYSLSPRIASVSGNLDSSDERIIGIVEEGGSARAVLATFRMERPSGDKKETCLTAWMAYREKEPIGFSNDHKEIGRINQGTWLDEEYNFVEMGLPDTKELVLAVQSEEGAECFAVQDNRFDPRRNKGLALNKIQPDGNSFYVDVTLVDHIYGPLVSFSYQIDVKPLKVQPVLRVPRA